MREFANQKALQEYVELHTVANAIRAASRR